MASSKYGHLQTVATSAPTARGGYLIVSTKGKWGLSKEPLKPGSRCRISGGKARAA